MNKLNERLNEATEHNRNGAMFLATQQCPQALQSFKASLNILNEVVSDPTFVQNRPDLLEEHDIQRRFVEISAFDDQYFFVYNRAMIFECPTLETIFVASDSVLFNTALAFHLIGLQKGKKDLLQRALLMYSSFTSLQPQAIGMQVLTMAALNNQAWILHTIGHHDSSQAVLMQVQSMLHDVIVNDLVSELVEPRHLVEFNLNVLLMKAPTLAASA